MRPMTALALLSAVVGCASGPRGPHAEFRAGITPVAPPAPVSAAYLLHSAGTRVAVQRAEKGEPVGFAQNPDGTVSAVAPDFDRPLTDGSYTWELLHEKEESESWFRRRCRAATDRLALPVFVLLLLAGSAAYALAASNSHR